VSIYSSLPPTHQLPREPINALRARQGLRPLCFNHADFPELVEVQDGWTADGRCRLITIANRMSKHCVSWSVAAHENPATESIPGRESWRCLGCRHLPTDPRVIERARKAEAA
jgi:hypothetical protein